MNIISRINLTLSIIIFFRFLGFSAHIIGGHISYEVLSTSNSSSEVLLNIEVYRDGNSSGATFDQQLRLGIYRKLSAFNYQFVQGIVGIEMGDIIEASIDESINCETTSIGSSERTTYQTTVEIPNDESDYMIAYQRCCRTPNIINILSPEESGLALHMLITAEGLAVMNKSHIIDKPLNRYLRVNESNTISLFQSEDANNQYSTEIIKPVTAGGLDGSGGNNGDPDSCTGITPDPITCPPPFIDVSLANNVNEESLFFENDEFSKLSQSEYSFTPHTEGNYLIAYYIHEYKNNVLMSSHYREQVFVVTDCNVVLGNNNTELKNKIVLYPNPAKNVLYFNNESNILPKAVSIINVTGQKQLSSDKSNVESIDVSSLSTGVYIIELQICERIERRKFIKS